LSKLKDKLNDWSTFICTPILKHEHMSDSNDKITRALIVKFLSECFHYPDNEQINALKDYKDKLPDRYSDIIVKIEDIKEMQVDYSRLFVGPFELLSAPYGSVYLEDGRKTLGDSTMDVVQFYQQENLSLQFKELPDHIAVELEFLYFLMAKELMFLDNDDLEQSKLCLEKQKQFINRHLANWINDFTDLIIQNANSDFYSQVAGCLKQEINDLQYNANKDCKFKGD